MANGFDPRATAARPAIGAGLGREGVAFDAGLRSYMLSVYNYMASGVLWTGIVAYTLYLTGTAQAIFGGGGILRYAIIFAPLLMVMVMGFRAHKMSTAGMQAFYWAFATVMGLSMSVIPLVYSGQSIAATFFATAAASLRSACGATRPRRTCRVSAPS
jgi:FtsH-binding integral membrane protein